MFGKLFSANTFTDPARLDSALLAVTSAVDDRRHPGQRATCCRWPTRCATSRRTNVDYFTAPVLGTGMEGAASVVYLDTVAGERMWAYLRNDSLSQNAAEFSKQALPDVPR